MSRCDVCMENVDDGVTCARCAGDLSAINARVAALESALGDAIGILHDVGLGEAHSAYIDSWRELLGQALQSHSSVHPQEGSDQNPSTPPDLVQEYLNLQGRQSAARQSSDYTEADEDEFLDKFQQLWDQMSHDQRDFINWRSLVS